MCKIKPIIRDVDHDDYFSKRVYCGYCRRVIGCWNYGRSWCDGSKERFINENKSCQECGNEIDWSDEEHKESESQSINHENIFLEIWRDMQA